MESKTPSIIDLNGELAKLSMFRGLTPRTTRAERQGSATLLGSYRDGRDDRYRSKGHVAPLSLRRGRDSLERDASRRPHRA